MRIFTAFIFLLMYMFLFVSLIWEYIIFVFGFGFALLGLCFSHYSHMIISHYIKPELISIRSIDTSFCDQQYK